MVGALAITSIATTRRRPHLSHLSHLSHEVLTYLVSYIVQVRILDDSFGRPAQAAQHHPEQAPPGGLVDAMRVMGTSISQCGTSYYMAPEVRVVPTTLADSVCFSPR